jgi:UDP-N-acetylglucosamine 2-epimerase (non-hydrolysing)
MAPVINALKRHSKEFCFIATGQHHDYEMAMRFIEELSLPTPEYSFQLQSSSPTSQIGEMMSKLEGALQSSASRLILVQGDTNSMLAAALTGVKMGLTVAHIEAGLRSYDWRMPEEHNRRMVDHVSDVLFAPTQTSMQNLTNEGVYGKIVITGNTVVDSVNHYLPLALKTSHVMNRISFNEFCLATIHRKENVDSSETLRDLVAALLEIGTPVVFPVHPRTETRLREFGLYEKTFSSPNILPLPPISYADSLILQKNCKFILTDSGGLQEEATVPSIRKPVILLRSSTERPEGIETGFTKLAGVNRDKILSLAKQLLKSPPQLPSLSPFGDGKAGERIVDTIENGLFVPEPTVSPHPS